MSRGWIKLYRQILDHDFWRQPRRFSNAEAWIDLLLSANHEDRDVVIGTQKVTVKRGQVLTSQRKLAQRWGWDRETVSRYLKLCFKLGQTCPIKTSRGTSHGYTLITIRNYGKYQDRVEIDAATDATANAAIKPATMPPPMPHNQECKEWKEERDSVNVKRSPARSKDPDPRVREFIGWFAGNYETKFCTPYHVVWGKDGRLAKDLLATYKLDQLKDAGLRFLNSTDSWVRQNGGYTIGVFASQINKLVSTSYCNSDRVIVMPRLGEKAS